MKYAGAVCPKLVNMRPSDAEAFRSMWASGSPCKAMARKFGVHVHTISKHAKRIGLPSRRGRLRGPSVSIIFPNDMYAWLKARAPIARYVRSLIQADMDRRS